jgi:phosphoglycolate phosphatase-like HAD superfamily hydrolase
MAAILRPQTTRRQGKLLFRYDKGMETGLSRYDNALLVLFDIDGTLLLSNRIGYRAMLRAAAQIAGRPVSLDGVDFSGRLDPEIWTGIAELNGIADATSREGEFRAAYTSILTGMLQREAPPYTLPGVPGLISRLRSQQQVTLGLCTGNYPQTGNLKIRAAGLDPDDFPVGAWGCDGLTRRDLPRTAMRRYEELRGSPIAPRRVIVVGDTPLDIDCAHANGCMALAVATGPSYPLETLQAHNADLTVSDLSDTDSLTRWILGHAGSPREISES